jgi:hypothetical protein
MSIMDSGDLSLPHEVWELNQLLQRQPNGSNDLVSGRADTTQSDIVQQPHGEEIRKRFIGSFGDACIKEFYLFFASWCCRRDQNANRVVSYGCSRLWSWSGQDSLRYFKLGLGVLSQGQWGIYYQELDAF